MIISFYFFLAVREKEFLYFSLWLLLASLESIPSLNDVFLREYPVFLLYLYIFSNSIIGSVLIHSLRQFLKPFKHFSGWDKFLVIFSFLQVIVLFSSHFTSSAFHTNLSAPSHFSYNLIRFAHGIILLITLFLYIRAHDKATRLMIIAFTPILLLLVIS